ncbi:MAG: FKBP-type peptidyl-prolyl cis-trans isomerase [Solirubrobacteraceae bacterium]|nr:FKBP-type peptidyl-prolyl cis-trans isomerase [Solirubrobacteraceae bacterium]
MTLRTTTRRVAATLLFAAAGTTLAACGDDEKTASSTTPAITYQQVAVGNSKDLKKKPAIDIPDILPPSGDKIIKQDIVVGTGPTVRTGDELTASYVGVAWSSNKQFDASWDRPEKAIPFTLAQGSVIDGWTQGLPGMKVGGRRLLIVPPSKGYGDQGQGEDIPGGETLVFIVDAKSTKKGAPVADAGAGAAGGADAATQAQIQQAIQQAQAQAAGGGQ